MIHCLAKADLHDFSNNLPLVLIACAVLAGAALLAFLPIRTARVRKHRYADQLTAGAIVWALIAAGSVIYPVYLHFQLAEEQARMMANGFLDLAVRSQPPALPWPFWIVLAALYGLIFLLAAKTK